MMKRAIALSARGFAVWLAPAVIAISSSDLVALNPPAVGATR
jgi:hypothetical protein